ncbi:hypothetical protein [Streptomyces sp. A1547]|uniref:hypothetical protein n=1 Tax=Streptomyces sp. A1547 TaxID=2563105 RepID=UPI00109EA888|nr:hypothetical protein [Streptomyces sp. A1547]THA38252.1 hypothetical protein E6W17_17460 [Streptomyces sp. A1547]
MELDKRPPGDGGEGCLVGVIRVPVKIVALIVVLPVRVVWDLLVAFGQAAARHVLRPLSVYVLQPVLRGIGRVLTVLLKLVFVWPWVGLWRYVLRPLYAHLLAPVGRALYAYLLRPLGEALAWVGRGGMRYLLAPLAKGVMWLVRAVCMTLFVWPWVGLWRYVLAPVGRGLLWVGAGFHRYVLTPVGHGLAAMGSVLYRYLLRPVGIGVYRYVLVPLWQVLVWAWHVAGRIVRAVWRGVRLAGWVLVGWPAAQVYRHVLTPVGHVVRDVWRTVRATVREVRADVRRVLFGGPGREPVRSRARTLGSTTAAGKNAPAPEISLHEQKQG